MKWLVLVCAVVMLLRSVSAFTTRALAPSTRKATPTTSRAAHGISRTSSRGGVKTGRVVRVPFLNQGLAKAAHTRLFSTTEDAAPAAAAPAATEGELQTNWLDDSKTTLRLSWSPSSLPSSSSSYRISYTRDGIPNYLTVGGGSEEAVLRGLEGGGTYEVVVVQVEGESLKETVVGRTKVETAKAPEAPKGELTELSRLEIRTGKIIEIGRHPEADGLYVEKIDLGEADGPRTIVSGLVKYQTEEQLLGREVVVLANLKPRALKGIMSHGMLLCASNEDHTVVTPLSPPAGVAIGELITFEGHAAAPEPPGNRAGKAFDRVADDLFAGEDMVASYKGIPFMTSKGPVMGGMKGSIS